MDRKYIMIDSTYRDRLLYPNAAEFIMPINAHIGNSPFNSRNPLASGYPIHSFSFLSVGATFSGTVVGGNPSALQVDPSIDTLVGLSVPDNGTTLDQANDSIINLSLSVAGDANVYRIVSYDAVRRIVYLDTPILNFSVSLSYTITNQSTSSTIVLQGYNVSYVGSSANQDGYFISSNQTVYVWDQTLNEVQSGILTSYSVLLTKPFSAGWSVNDKYTLALDQEIDRGVIAPPYYLCNGVYQAEISFAGCGYSNHMEVQLVTSYESRPVDSLAVARIVYVQSNDGGAGSIEMLYCGKDYVANGEYYMLPVGQTFRQGLGTVVITGTGVGFIVQSRSNQHMAMVGCYFMPMLFTAEYNLNPSDSTLLQINPNKSLPFVPIQTIPSNTIMGGNSLNGITPILAVLSYNNQLILVTQPVDGMLYQRFHCSNLASFPEALNYEIISFFKDGCINMDYRGTIVSSNQMVCYSLSINTLILPNQILNLPFGSLTSSYPYVFVEITNETASSGHNKSIIYSNNPNAVSATFICSISDVNNPIITKFININSDRSSQIVKFKPNDNLKFRVSMPDGSTFQTELNDYIPPLQTNPLLQITCLVEIIRL